MTKLPSKLVLALATFFLSSLRCPGLEWVNRHCRCPRRRARADVDLLPACSEKVREARMRGYGQTVPHPAFGHPLPGGRGTTNSRALVVVRSALRRFVSRPSPGVRGEGARSARMGPSTNRDSPTEHGIAIAVAAARYAVRQFLYKQFAGKVAHEDAQTASHLLSRARH